MNEQKETRKVRVVRRRKKNSYVSLEEIDVYLQTYPCPIKGLEIAPKSCTGNFFHVAPGMELRKVANVMGKEYSSLSRRLIRGTLPLHEIPLMAKAMRTVLGRDITDQSVISLLTWIFNHPMCNQKRQILKERQNRNQEAFQTKLKAKKRLAAKAGADPCELKLVSSIKDLKELVRSLD